MEVVYTLRLKMEKVFFGPGPCRLLEEIERTGSLRQASQELELSYTKALRILRDIEQELGYPVVLSTKGGSNRGGTKITDNGRKFLKIYKELDRELKEIAEKLIEERFTFLEK